MRPKSVSNPWVVSAGLLAFLSSLGLIRVIEIFQRSSILAALFCILTTLLVLALFDLGIMKVHRRESTGLDFKVSRPSMGRAFTKFLGFLGSLGFVAIFYLVFPEYRDDFYASFWMMLKFVWVYALPLAFLYIFLIDRHMKNPEDSYYHFGRFLTGKGELKKVGGQHFLGWLIKGFFLPLMFTYLVRDLTKFKVFDFSNLTSFYSYFDFAYSSLFMIDVGLVSMGYIFSLRLLDSHLRSSEPTFLGWAAALACYEPLWGLVGVRYLAYSGTPDWKAWLGDSMMGQVWGVAILILVVIYVWASVMFGARFSNLTHRGIITNGVYAWTKHPAYVAKNLSWWLMAVPFLGTGSDAVRRSFLLLGLNAIYFLRARTEERHLSRDPDYVKYALYMNEHSIFAGVANRFTWLKYQAPRQGL